MSFFQAWVIETSVVEREVTIFVEVKNGSDAPNPAETSVCDGRHVHRETRTDGSVEHRHVNAFLTWHYM